MKIDGALNVWGKGQLIAYSGIDGETDYDDGLVLRSREEGGFDLCLPEPGRILLPGGAPRRCFLASDCFELDGIRGVLPECRHLLIEGDGCSATSRPENWPSCGAGTACWSALPRTSVRS